MGVEGAIRRPIINLRKGKTKPAEEAESKVEAVGSGEGSKENGVDDSSESEGGEEDDAKSEEGLKEQEVNEVNDKEAGGK